MAGIDPKRPLGNLYSMVPKRARIALGLLSAMAIWWGLDYFAFNDSATLEVALIRMSIGAFIGFLFGGLIASDNFLIPATVLALVLWVATTSYSLFIGMSIDNPMWPQFVWNLPSLVLLPAVAIGAIVGTSVAKMLRGMHATERT